MMEWVWTEQLSVGNLQIDSEHRHIMQIVGSVDKSLVARDQADLLRSLNLLLDSMQTHFRNEESIARAVGYPFGEHILSHQYMLKKLHGIRGGIDAGSESLTVSMAEDLTDLLKSWLIDHVMKEDMLMKPMLENHFYNFTIE